MSVEYYNGDIFEAPIDILIHQANCQNTMGSGIAKDIRARFPEVYEADCKTIKGDRNKLGTASFCCIRRPDTRIKVVYNMYGQYYYGRDRRYTDYEAYYNGLEYIKDYIMRSGKEKMTVGIPYKMGCNLAGGDWNICETMIRSVFNNDIKVLICKKD